MVEYFEYREGLHASCRRGPRIMGHYQLNKPALQYCIPARSRNPEPLLCRNHDEFSVHLIFMEAHETFSLFSRF